MPKIGGGRVGEENMSEAASDSLLSKVRRALR